MRKVWSLLCCKQFFAPLSLSSATIIQLHRFIGLYKAVINRHCPASQPQRLRIGEVSNAVLSQTLSDLVQNVEIRLVKGNRALLAKRVLRCHFRAFTR